MVVAYTYINSEEDVLIKQERHNCFKVQRRRALVSIQTEVRDSLQAAEKVYDSFLGDEPSYEEF